MQLIWEDEYILMIICDSKAFYIYDEEDNERSEMLRRVTGGHKDEISIIRFNEHLSLIATGSLDGEVCLWDFEFSKLEGICKGHKLDITGIEFIDPYPLMLTSSMDATLCLWTVRPIPTHLRHFCIHRFINRSWSFSRDVDSPISKIALIK